MNQKNFNDIVAELSLMKETDPIEVGDRIKAADEAIQMQLAEALGYAIGKTRIGRSFRRINKRNTVVAGTAGIIFNKQETQVLMQERWGTDGMWEPSGGGLRFGENLKENVVREAYEETGYSTVITGFIGVFASPRPEEILIYPDQEHRHCVMSIFALEAIAKLKEPDDEVTDLRWVDIGQVLEMPMLPVHRRTVIIGLSPRINWPVIV